MEHRERADIISSQEPPLETHAHHESSCISVITTILNEGESIDRLIESLVQQSLPATEIIVVDGGSTDGTWERLQQLTQNHPMLVAVRDESCRLQNCPGPISRGRNVAIAAASCAVIACVDAGCTYQPDWLENLTFAIRKGNAEYAVGGSCIDPESPTVWDLAAAPFLGVKLSPDAKTKSCTARSMVFRKDLWQRIGGFPEDRFFGEDTMFDMKARALAQPAFADRAKAYYRPQWTFVSALRQLASYSVSDGISRVRPARLFRNLARCVLEVVALVMLYRTPIPLLLALALELYFAFHFELGNTRGQRIRVIGARLLFSLAVPWVVAWNQIKGFITKASVPNRQNQR